MDEGATSMRSAVAIALILGALTISSGSPSALPLALGDHAALSREASVAVMQVAHRHYYTRHAKRYVYNAPRRYNWQYYPYWRPYQYRYWQHYYPYGGPLF
jgi:hypothetical protein